MATRFYFPSTGSGSVPNYPTRWTYWSGPVFRPLSRAKVGSASTNLSITTTASPSNADHLLAVYTSQPLAEAVTLSGTVKGQFRSYESSSSGNFHTQIKILVFDSSGTQRGVLYAGDQRTGTVDEVSAVSATNQKVPATSATNATTGVATLSSVDAEAGDVIVVEIGGRPGSTSSGYIYYMAVGDVAGSDLPVEAAGGSGTGDPWIEFSFSLPWVEVVPELQLPQAFVEAVAPGWSDGNPITVAAPVAAAIAAAVGVEAAPLSVELDFPVIVVDAVVPIPDLVDATLSLYAPPNEAYIPATKPMFTVNVATFEANVAVDIQYATDEVFTSPTTVTADAPAGQSVVRATAQASTTLIEDTTYYWRARPKNDYATGNTWTEPFRFTVNASDAVAIAAGTWTVTTATTNAPHLWFVRPVKVRPGDTAHVYGTNFADTAVEVFLAGVECTVVSWDAVAADADAYTADRRIDPGTGDCNPAHQVIEIVVPDINGPGGVLYVSGS